MTRTRVRKTTLAAALLAAALVAAVLAAAATAAGVDPSSFSATLAPGGSTSLTKTVHTPAIPPNPDIVFLADTTGSMGTAVGNVRTNAGAIMSQVLASQPTAEFGAAEYKDFDAFDPFAFRLNQAITANTADVQNGMTQWVAGGGDDTPEAQLNALWTLATSGATGFRTGSSRIIVWFGDSSGHDPSGGHSQAAAIAALQAAGITVLAIPITAGGDGLDSTGQATAITTATGGSIVSAAPNAVAAAILSGLSNLPATVTHTESCDAALTDTLTPASITVTSGLDAVFNETISVDPNAVGGTHTCTVSFLVNGLPAGPAFVQTVSIDVPNPDLSIAKTGPALVQTGDLVTYTLTATNNGPSAATGVAISDPVPANSTFVSADPGCAALAGVVTCTVGNLAAGASQVFHVTVQAGTGSSLTNTATVAGGQGDPNPGNNSATVTSTVNHPPDCSAATVGPSLWPPNHKLSDALSVSGLTDPDGNPVSVHVDSIFQDEPTNGLGDGDTGPNDAVILGANSFQVRAERSGNLNGRAYYVNFTGSDGQGGSCTGTATIMVPHDQAHAPVGDGQLFNSIP